MNDWNLGNLEGLIPLAAGIYFLGLARGLWPKKLKNPEKFEQWRTKFGGFIKIAGPLLIVLGVLQLTGVL